MYILKDLHVRLTTSCNLQCKHCYAADWSQYHYELEYELVRNTILQAIELGCISVTFSGGEPFIYPEIYNLIRFCIKHELKVNLETNGMLGDINKLLEFQGSDLLRLKVSYDGEELRGEGADLVRNNISELKKQGFNVTIQTVLTKINLDEIEAVLEFSENLDIPNRLFMGHSKSGSGASIPNFTIDEVLRLEKKLTSKYSHIIVELPELISGKQQKSCGWGVSRCEIMPNGDVTSCAPLTYTRKEFIAGNIKDAPLKKLWNSEYFARIRELKQQQFLGVCSTCEYFDTCKGSCRSVSASIGGDILSSYPYCEQYTKQIGRC